jgi:hypothetical protein
MRKPGGGALKRAAIEPLESRQLLSVTLAIQGTSGNDNVQIISYESEAGYRYVNATVNGTPLLAEDARVDDANVNVTYDGHGGHDSISFAQSAAVSWYYLSGDLGGTTEVDLSTAGANGQDFFEVAAPQHLQSLEVGGSEMDILPEAGTVDVAGQLTLDDGSSILMSPNGGGGQLLLTAGSLSVGSAQLDLANNQMILTGGGDDGVSQIASLIADNVLLSSTANNDPSQGTALGYVLNTDANGSAIYNTFAGQPVGSGDVLVKYTYLGDANLDGRVNEIDYGLIDNGSANNLTGWGNGDFNNDGTVDDSDYALIDTTASQPIPDVPDQTTFGTDESITFPADTVGDAQYIINWGDGQTDSVSSSYSDPTTIVNHPYTGTGNFQAQIEQLLYDESGTSLQQQFDSPNIPVTVSPQSPTDVTAAWSDEDAGVDVTWTTASGGDGATKYLIQRSDSGGVWSTIQTVDATSETTSYTYTDTTAPDNGANSLYRALAVGDDNGTSTNSDGVSSAPSASVLTTVADPFPWSTSGIVSQLGITVDGAGEVNPGDDTWDDLGVTAGWTIDGTTTATDPAAPISGNHTITLNLYDLPAHGAVLAYFDVSVNSVPCTVTVSANGQTLSYISDGTTGKVEAQVACVHPGADHGDETITISASSSYSGLSWDFGEADVTLYRSVISVAAPPTLSVGQSSVLTATADGPRQAGTGVINFGAISGDTVTATAWDPHVVSFGDILGTGSDGTVNFSATGVDVGISDAAFSDVYGGHTHIGLQTVRPRIDLSGADAHGGIRTKQSGQTNSNGEYDWKGTLSEANVPASHTPNYVATITDTKGNAVTGLSEAVNNTSGVYTLHIYYTGTVTPGNYVLTVTDNTLNPSLTRKFIVDIEPP